MKPSDLKHYTTVVFSNADRSHCTKLKVGAIAVKDRRIICEGFNGTIPGDNNDCESEDIFGELKTRNTVEHAERNLISYAARKGIALEGATLYVTHAPCIPCSRAILNAGIKEVFYFNSHNDDEGPEFLRYIGKIAVTKLTIN